VGLAAAERGLELHHRVAAAPAQALEHTVEQQRHALGDVGALEEQRRVLVLGRRRAGDDLGQVGRELGLQQVALKHVTMRDDDFTPGFQVHGFAGSAPVR
jgi:hypothetical protein